MAGTIKYYAVSSASPIFNPQGVALQEYLRKEYKDASIVVEDITDAVFNVDEEEPPTGQAQ